MTKKKELSIAYNGEIIVESTNKGTQNELVYDQIKPLKASHSGILTIADTKIPCAVLNDGTRLLTQRGVSVALGRHKNPTQGQASTGDRPAFLSANNLDPYIPSKLKELWKPIPYQSQGGYRGNIAFGYKAEILPLVCSVYLDAEEAGKLLKNQEHIARKCKMLIRGLAHVGIIALVDEATGYQEVRDRLALQEILRRYISDELLEWAKRFPDEFYKEMFRLRGWSWNSLSSKRPGIAGKLTTDIVYQRLAPGVLDTLRSKTPRDAKGRPKNKLHQLLTTDVGIPELDKHLHTVLAFMRASTTWAQFYRSLDRAFPKFSETLPLALEYKEDSD